MFEAVHSPHVVPFDGTFRIDDAPTRPPEDAPSKQHCEARLAQAVERIAELQPILYAHDRRSLLLVFQALDAAGKDGTIRAVLQGVNPAGCQVHSFKAPSAEELDHDFLWRTSSRLPARGMIGVFNRSYYEEVLVVRVHAGLLHNQNLPWLDEDTIWRERFDSIRDHELHLARNGTTVLKFFLHVSADEQRRRFLSRLDEPHKNWKFSEGDVREREHRAAYIRAFQDALRATSRAWAPWYSVPADKKAYTRMVVAEIVAQSLERMGLHYPAVRGEDRARFDLLRRVLDEE